MIFVSVKIGSYCAYYFVNCFFSSQCIVNIFPSIRTGSRKYHSSISRFYLMAGWFQRSSTCLPVLSLLHLQATLLASRWIFQKYCLHPGSESLMNFLPSTSPNCPEGGVFTQNFIPGYSQQTPIDLCTFVLHNFLCKSLFQTRSHPKLLVIIPQ